VVCASLFNFRPGLFYAVNYARDLRTSVSTHAKRLACQQIAGAACLATIECVDLLARECGDKFEGPDNNYCLNLWIGYRGQDRREDGRGLGV
jgi:hypothetical protein